MAHPSRTRQQFTPEFVQAERKLKRVPEPFTLFVKGARGDAARDEVQVAHPVAAFEAMLHRRKARTLQHRKGTAPLGGRVLNPQLMVWYHPPSPRCQFAKLLGRARMRHPPNEDK